MTDYFENTALLDKLIELYKRLKKWVLDKFSTWNRLRKDKD